MVEFYIDSEECCHLFQEVFCSFTTCRSYMLTVRSASRSVNTDMELGINCAVAIQHDMRILQIYSYFRKLGEIPVSCYVQVLVAVVISTYFWSLLDVLFRLPCYIDLYLRSAPVFIHSCIKNVSVWDPTMHFKLVNLRICILERPENDTVRVETCCPEQ